MWLSRQPEFSDNHLYRGSLIPPLRDWDRLPKAFSCISTQIHVEMTVVAPFSGSEFDFRQVEEGSRLPYPRQDLLFSTMK